MEVPEEVIEIIKGIRYWRNKNGFAVCEVHYSADEEKGQEWVERELRGVPGGMDSEIWRIEYEIDWRAGGGVGVYSKIFKEEQILERFDIRKYTEIYEAWDFGYRRPAVLWGVIDVDDRLVIVGENLGFDIMLEEYIEHILRERERRFGRGKEYISICDIAGQAVKDTGESSIRILSNYGIHCRAKRVKIHEGIEDVRRLMRQREDGLYGLMVVRNECPILIEALRGGYRYKEKGDEVEKDGYYEHIADCLRYMVANLGVDILREQHTENIILRKKYQQEQRLDPLSRLFWRMYKQTKKEDSQQRLDNLQEM